MPRGVRGDEQVQRRVRGGCRPWCHARVGTGLMDFSGVSVLVLGDVMLDRFVEGEIDRISPEAPVPVLRVRRTRAMPGGAANVAVNVASLGGTAVLVGLVGQDEAAASLGALLRAHAGIDTDLVASPSRPTICKTRFIASRQQVVRTDDEVTADADEAEGASLAASLAARIGAARALVLSDYGKGTLSPAVLAHALDLARARRIPVFVDPKGDDFGRYRGATCITPNQKELGRAVRRTLETEAEIVDAARGLADAVGCDAILATRSERGMILVERDRAPVSVPARAREVFDVSGAGDTVIATLALAHASGLPLAASVRVANAAAGVVVSKLGTASANIAEVMHELASGDAPNGAAAVGPLPAARVASLVAHWKDQGLSVGFTNGCFDILHAGHVSLLAAARGACDRLVVAVNDDASVRRLKGPSRPVNPLGSRAAVLAAIRHVDAVTSFADDTPRALIAELRPDVLVKGSDYTVDRVVGAELVPRVVLVDLVDGHSTTAIIRKASGA